MDVLRFFSAGAEAKKFEHALKILPVTFEYFVLQLFEALISAVVTRNSRMASLRFAGVSKQPRFVPNELSALFYGLIVDAFKLGS